MILAISPIMALNVNENCVLLIEPFYGGSHKQLIDFIVSILQERDVKYHLITLPGKKWHWRARTGALYMSRKIPKTTNYRIIFCSSTLNLAELLALRPELLKAQKVIYFHENQFTYPQQVKKDRDFQYGYNTILSALVADHVVFNSCYNKSTFLDNINRHLRTQPDFRVDELRDEIEPKATVLYFPITIKCQSLKKPNDVLHIVWPHRWEHDKDPGLFFRVLFKLQDAGRQFRLSVLGQSFTDKMPIFSEAATRLAEHIAHFGRLESRQEYEQVLHSAHIVVSTARHEFYGVAMLEAVHCGCLPLAPNNLVYPEIYPRAYLFNTEQQLLKLLKSFCKRPESVDHFLKGHPIDLSRFCQSTITSQFTSLFQLL